MDSLIETLRGNGEVFDGNTRLSKVQYEVRVYQHYVESVTVTGHALVPSGKHNDLFLSKCSAPLMPSTARLTLVMNDSRKLNFYVTGDGVCKATGAIFE